MLLVSYKYQGQNRIGIYLEDWVFDLRRVRREYLLRMGAVSEPDWVPNEMTRFMQDGYLESVSIVETFEFILEHFYSEFEESLMKDIILPVEEVDLQPPVRTPGKIVCVGLNYPEFFIDLSSSAPQYPVLFLKPASTLIGNGQSIRIPTIAKEVLYEGELAVVVGKIGKNIPEHEAFEYVAGYTIANDIGAHDLEQRTSQWTTGKMLDTFCPLGPYLVTRDEIPNPNDLRIKTNLNGEVVQDGSTNEMLFSIPYLVSYISSLATLEAGDIILTGSPKRRGAEADVRKRMKSGDEISVWIEKIGILSNPVEAEE